MATFWAAFVTVGFFLFQYLVTLFVCGIDRGLNGEQLFGIGQCQQNLFRRSQFAFLHFPNVNQFNLKASNYYKQR